MFFDENGKPNYTKVGSRLLQIRMVQKKKMNQNVFATEIAKCSLASWQEHETGKSAPSAKVLFFLIKAGFSANWILTGEGQREYPGVVKSEVSTPVDSKESIENMETVVKVLWEEVASSGATLTPTGASGIVAMAFEEYSVTENYETLCKKMKTYVRLANQENK
jgi:hypothetical protein